ncbi:protein transport protein Sec16B [Gracilinanus agilis]|uniref:protein transport protein Sec16B n=1 Tax=Gracilinanus agilis TaxID=191870 RepID=UPI001CFEC9F2|nr:protein transport protein Sec16B [Gracilinanus agilis]
MEPWVPLPQPQPQGKPVAQPKGLQKGGYHKPIVPEKFYQWSDLRGGPPPWPDQQTGYQRPSHLYRPGDQRRIHSGTEYYEGGYPGQLYPRSGYENPYQHHPPTSTREDYSYGSYYHGHPQLQKEERVPRQGSPYTRHGDYRDQNPYSDYREERQSSPFGTNGEIHFRSKNYEMHKENSVSDPAGQEKPGEEDLQHSKLEGANELPLASESSLLQQYKESGLSSSSYELSQYMLDSPDQYDSTPFKTWSPVQTKDAAVGPVDPMKFFIPHAPVCFGPGGQLILVCPNHPADGQTALVEVHSLEVLLNDTEEQEELRAFSGPLIREDVHKVDVMLFCQQKAALSCKAETPRGRDLALLWKLLVLLCRQNGSMVGSDVAELLMQDCKKLEKYRRQAPVANLINLTDDDWPVPRSGTPNLLTGEIPPSIETKAQIIEKFTKLLFYGRKKATGKGQLEAAHFCYLMAHMPFGHYSVKTDHLVLLGSSHSQEFLKFATTEAIQRTEIFEYCQMLGRPTSFIPSFQVYKLLYASRLADFGLPSQALHYCEGISSVLLNQTESSHPVLLAELIKLSEQLKLSDPLLLERRHRGKEQEPEWLVKLRERQRELEFVKKAEDDLGDPDFIYTDILKARQPTAENSFYQDSHQGQGYSEPLRYTSFTQLPPEGTSLSQPNMQQPLPFQPILNPSGEGPGYPGTSVPLYARPEMTMVVSSAKLQPEEDQQAPPPPEDIPESQKSYQYQYPEIQKDSVAPRVRGISETSTISLDEEKEDSSDDDEKKADEDNVKGKKESGKSEKGSGFGWFGWFRSKPAKNVEPSGEEDSSDSPDSEESSAEAQAPLASATPSGPSNSFFLPQPDANTFSRSLGKYDFMMVFSERRGSMTNKSLPGMEAAPHELHFNPGGLPPPPTLGNAIPLYNPSQVPQLSITTSTNRPNRLAQRRYPTQK